MFPGTPCKKITEIFKKPLKENHTLKGAVAVIVGDLPYDALHLKRAIAYKSYSQQYP